MASEGNTPRYPLYDTTFTLHRLSPLYIGSDASINNPALSQHARRFRDIIVGDVLRGVQVGLESEDSTIASLGALQSVTWRLLPHEDSWSTQDTMQVADEEDTTVVLSTSYGMLVRITYERNTYTAILLRDTQRGIGDESTTGINMDEDGFAHFPLLLTKLPGPLRGTFVDFLATTFDTRVSVLRLPSAYITTAFERYVAYVCIREDGDSMDVGESSRALRQIVGGIMVSIGINLPNGSSALKGINIKIGKGDLPAFISRGKSLEHGVSSSSFVNALAAYVKTHMALDLAHERVNIIAIGCEAFSLGAEGKVKLTSPPTDNDGESPGRRATKRLLNHLIVFAKGGALAEGYINP